MYIYIYPKKYKSIVKTSPTIYKTMKAFQNDTKAKLKTKVINRPIKNIC